MDLFSPLSIIIAAVVVAYYVLSLAGLYKTFQKMGFAGWKGLVPVYNTYLLFRVTGFSAWWLLLLLIPIANIFVMFTVYQRLGFMFNRSAYFGLLMIVLPFIGFYILGFSSSSYAEANLDKALADRQAARVDLTLNQKLTRYALAMGAVLMFLSFSAWWRYVHNSPTLTFYRMLENSLKTTSMTRTVSSGDESQELRQTIRLVNGVDHKVISKSSITQKGEVEAKVDTENIGTADKDYIRYLAITTNQKDKSGKPLDFSNSLNVWAVSDPATQSGTSIYVQTILGVIPFGNLRQQDRAKLMDYIRKNKVYSLDLKNVNKETVNGRPRYTYRVSINLKEYVTMLKEFALMNNIKQFESVDPNQYASAPPLQYSMTVDVMSGNLVNIIQSDSGRKEVYSSYGVMQKIEIPTNAIPFEELQSRLQKTQEQ